MASALAACTASANFSRREARNRAALYARIQLAAQSVCSFYVFKSDAAENGCINDAIASAVSKVNQPALFAVYNAKNKTPLPTALVSQSR
jgi:hypothetical protein